MMTLKAVWLMAAVVTSTPDTDGPPGTWVQKYEAASQAEKAGDPATAEALMKEVVGEAETLGQADLRLADPLEKLGLFYVRGTEPRYAEAEVLFRRALAIREHAQGAEHPDVADTLILVATCVFFAKPKQSDAAGPMLQRALDIYLKAGGENDPKVARVLHNMATWHLARREFGDSESALMRELAIREKAFGPESAKVADLLGDLGDIHAAQTGLFHWMRTRHAMQARAFYERALAIREKALKPGDPDIAESVYDLGQFTMIREGIGKAEPYFERWLALQEQAKAPASERQGKVLQTLASASEERNDMAEADRRLAKALAVLEDVKGAEIAKVAKSARTTRVLRQRAGLALKSGRFDDAERFLGQGLEVEAARIGPNDPYVTEARALVAGHAEDAQGQEIWHRLKDLGDRAAWMHDHDALGEILKGYADLLRRTNRVSPRRTTIERVFLN